LDVAHGYLATPVPEPPAIAMIAVGLGLLLVVMAGRKHAEQLSAKAIRSSALIAARPEPTKQ